MTTSILVSLALAAGAGLMKLWHAYSGQTVVPAAPGPSGVVPALPTPAGGPLIHLGEQALQTLLDRFHVQSSAALTTVADTVVTQVLVPALLSALGVRVLDPSPASAPK